MCGRRRLSRRAVLAEIRLILAAVAVPVGIAGPVSVPVGRVPVVRLRLGATARKCAVTRRFLSNSNVNFHFQLRPRFAPASVLRPHPARSAPRPGPAPRLPRACRSGGTRGIRLCGALRLSSSGDGHRDRVVPGVVCTETATPEAVWVGVPRDRRGLRGRCPLDPVRPRRRSSRSMSRSARLVPHRWTTRARPSAAAKRPARRRSPLQRSRS